ncbi:MAG: Rrf2 family transcriptional regulator [Caulobacter sp.]|nr:Rrf2 family transcriptional regulator [Caulobacter sp.]
MKTDTRLSGVLHVLLHIAQQDRPATSDTLALAMETHPVVIRRVLAGLRERGLVRSEKGHGGGWSLARPLAEITLRDVHEALGSPTVLAIGNRAEAPTCLVEQAVNAALDDVFDEAQAVLLRGLGGVTLATLSADFHARLKARATTGTLEDAHVGH